MLTKNQSDDNESVATGAHGTKTSNPSMIMPLQVFTLIAILVAVALGSYNVSQLSEEVAAINHIRDEMVSHTTVEHVYRTSGVDADHIQKYHMISANLSAPNSSASSPRDASSASGRQLDTLDNIVSIGKMAGSVWQTLHNSETYNLGAWTGAVKAADKNDWSSLGGFSSTVHSMSGISCVNGFGYDSITVDVGFTFEHNGQFVKNAKITAGGGTSWGFHSTVQVSVGEPTNHGTASYPVGNVVYTVTVQTGGVFGSSTMTYIVNLGGDGHWSWQRSGDSC